MAKRLVATVVGVAVTIVSASACTTTEEPGGPVAGKDETIVPASADTMAEIGVTSWVVRVADAPHRLIATEYQKAQPRAELEVAIAADASGQTTGEVRRTATGAATKTWRFVANADGVRDLQNDFSDREGVATELALLTYDTRQANVDTTQSSAAGLLLQQSVRPLDLTSGGTALVNGHQQLYCDSHIPCEALNHAATVECGKEAAGCAITFFPVGKVATVAKWLAVKVIKTAVGEALDVSCVGDAIPCIQALNDKLSRECGGAPICSEIVCDANCAPGSQVPTSQPAPQCGQRNMIVPRRPSDVAASDWNSTTCYQSLTKDFNASDGHINIPGYYAYSWPNTSGLPGQSSCSGDSAGFSYEEGREYAAKVCGCAPPSMPPTYETVDPYSVCKGDGGAK